MLYSCNGEYMSTFWRTRTLSLTHMHAHTFRHAQILGTLHAYTHWFAQFYLDSVREDNHTHLESTLVPIITTLVDSSVPLISHQVSVTSYLFWHQLSSEYSLYTTML